MGAAIEQEFGLACEYVGGSGGILEVALDGEIVYSNGRMGGVPDPGIVLAALRQRLG